MVQWLGLGAFTAVAHIQSLIELRPLKPYSAPKVGENVPITPHPHPHLSFSFSSSLTLSPGWVDSRGKREDGEVRGRGLGGQWHWTPGTGAWNTRHLELLNLGNSEQDARGPTSCDGSKRRFYLDLRGQGHPSWHTAHGLGTWSLPELTSWTDHLQAKGGRPGRAGVRARGHKGLHTGVTVAVAG